MHRPTLRIPSAIATILLAATGADASAAGDRVSAPAVAQDLLAAEQQGLVEVRFIPVDSRSANVVVTNRADRPLTLRLPGTFAGAPVLAQQFGAAPVGFAGAGMNAGPQNVAGGGMQNAGMGIGNPVGGGGPFSLPPERTRTLRVPTVCLEHGKREPTPRVPYRMVSLASCASDQRLPYVMEGLASGRLSQQVAQAATWHIASGLSWEQLAAEKIDMAGGDPDVPTFSPAELIAARQVVEQAAVAVRQSGEAEASRATTDTAAR